MNSNNDILKINNLKKIYHSKNGETLAVDNFSYTLKKGEFLSIVGPSGCGKSTILSMIGNLIENSGGTIEKNKNTKIGYMLQNDSLFEFRTILENCLLGLEITNQLTDEKKQYVMTLLEQYGLKEFINNYPSSLSGGMRQRVALIRTLACNPDILLLDEPFSALDQQSRLIVGNDVYKILKQEKRSAIMVSHDIAEAISMSDTIIVLSNRPCKIKAIYQINLSNSSTPIQNRKSKEFSEYYDKIWEEIDWHV